MLQLLFDFSTLCDFLKENDNEYDKSYDATIII
jgi:hypothetical protein